MEVQTKFTWERSPGEEIELTIGGEYTPANIPTEWEFEQGEFQSLDYVEDVEGNRLASWQFSPEELDAMRLKLLDTARAQIRSKAQFTGLRKLFNLPTFQKEQPFVE